MVAAVVALGDGQGANAEAKKIPDHKGKDIFKLNCTSHGGTFSEDAWGNTNCHWPGGGWTQCDANGNDCWYTPPPKQSDPIGPWDPYVGTGGEATTATGETNTSSPGGDDATPSHAGLSVAAHDEDQDQNTSKSRTKKGKKGGKGRRK